MEDAKPAPTKRNVAAEGMSGEAAKGGKKPLTTVADTD